MHDHEPIPREALPPGWGPADLSERRIAYRYDGPPIELVAAVTDVDRAHLPLGLCRCWELRVRHAVGELDAIDPIGRVSTRRAALDGLLRCMHRIHESVDDTEDSSGVRSTLDRVSLEGLVPDGMHTPE